MGAQDIVFLVPGFLGFESFGSFTYFADRVASVLRANLERCLPGQIQVIAVPTLPTGSLAKRQKALLTTLTKRLEAVGGAERVHLVGHSAGGVDSQLLTGKKPLEANAWYDLAGEGGVHARAHIRSVVSIGSPHHGTCLAVDNVARFVHEPVRHLRGSGAFAKLFVELVGSSFRDPEVHEALLGVFPEVRKVAQFTFEVGRWRDLISSLSPDAMAEVYATFESDLRDVSRRSFVTLIGTPRPNMPRSSQRHSDGPDAFCLDLMARTAGHRGAGGDENVLQRTLTRLRLGVDQPTRVIANAAAQIPSPIDASHNDGVVNSARQLVDPTDANELVAIVLADHFDVVGHYDRSIWVTDEQGNETERNIMSGLLHSGSHFGSDQFFELYRRVADTIAESCMR